MIGDTKICFLNKHNTTSNQFKLHTHNCYEIIYFAVGGGNVLINGKSYPVSTGSYCIIPPYAEHVEKLEGYSEILFIGFECNSSSYYLEEGNYYIDTIVGYTYFNEIFDEFKNQQSGFDIAAECLLRLFLVNLLRNARTSDFKQKDLNYIKEYIEQYADQKINFAQLAALSGYSYDYFRHMFRKRFGMSPQEYMIDVRLENAKRLLGKTNHSCTDIAYICGFSNGAQMTSMFKKKYGKTPKEFKITD
jgi:AraC-like DNA-binding protein